MHCNVYVDITVVNIQCWQCGKTTMEISNSCHYIQYKDEEIGYLLDIWEKPFKQNWKESTKTEKCLKQ